jgi:hypothetical protein
VSKRKAIDWCSDCPIFSCQVRTRSKCTHQHGTFRRTSIAVRLSTTRVARAEVRMRP